MSAAKRVCVRETVPLPKSFTTYELPGDKVIEYEFVIKNFEATQSQLDAIVKSPTFPGIDGLPQWHIVVCPRGNIDCDSPTAAKCKFVAGVRAVRLGKTSAVFDVKVRFLNDNRSVIMEKCISCKRLSLSNVVLVPFREDSPEAIPVGDSGDLKVNVEIILKEAEPIVVIQTGDDINIPTSTFSHDFSSELQSGIFSDFTIASNDQREFAVHKIILAKRVPFFDRMFNSGLEEVKKNRVEMKFSGDCIEAMLEYVYKDGVAKLGEVAVELLQLAHQYEVDRLMSICVAQMVRNVGEENLCESLRIADLYGIIPLQSACRKFIKDHPDATAKAILHVAGNK